MVQNLTVFLFCDAVWDAYDKFLFFLDVVYGSMQQCFAKHCCFLPFCGKIKKSYNVRVRQFLRMLLQRKKSQPQLFKP